MLSRGLIDRKAMKGKARNSDIDLGDYFKGTEKGPSPANFAQGLTHCGPLIQSRRNVLAVTVSY